MLYDVIVVGDYCLDLIFAGLPGFPELGMEIVAKHFAMLPGAAYNTVVAMHRLGMAVGWAGDFGNDDFSRYVLEQCRKEGLDETLFVHHRRPMRMITVAASYPNDRAFIAYYDRAPAIPAAIRGLAVAGGHLLHVPGLYFGGAFEAGLKMIRLKKMLLSMDGNSHESVRLENPRVRKSIQATDLFFANAREARRLTGCKNLEEAIARLNELSPLVVIKDGSNGAYGRQGGETLYSPALDLTPLDTTGAGDCFNAGFLRAWLKQKPLAECLRWGNIVGGLSTLGLGGTGQVTKEADVLSRLSTG